MKSIAMAMVLSGLAAAGCDKGSGDAAASGSAGSADSGKSAPSAEKETPPINKGKDGKENVELAEAYAKDVCECKDAQCINKAGEKYNDATNKLYADRQVRTPTPEQKKKMDDASARVSECTDKLLKKK